MRMTFAFAIAAIGVAAHPYLAAQSLDDYKRAVQEMENSKGCDSLPTSSQRGSCESLRRDIESYCKEESWSCQKAKLGTKALREQIAGREKALASLKSDDPSRNTMERDLQTARTSLRTDLSDIELRMAAGDKCLTARVETEKLFAAAIDQAERDGRAHAEIRPLANRLIYYWKGGNDRHKEARDLVSKGIEYCNRCRHGDE